MIPTNEHLKKNKKMYTSIKTEIYMININLKLKQKKNN